MKERNRKSSFTLFLLIAILSLAFISRFYNLSSWLFFGMDQEYEALIVKNIVTGKHFPLIGVNASDTGLYLGPLFIYFAVIPFSLLGGNPIGWAVTASTLGVFVTLLIYKIGNEMFSQRVGILASLIYAGSFLTSYYDRQFWNPMFVALFSLLIGYFLHLISKKQQKALIFLMVIFGLSLHVHLSLLIFVPLIGLVVWIRRKIFLPWIILASLFIFILLQTPLIVFEWRHNFLNSKAVINFVQEIPRHEENFSDLKQRNLFFLSSLGRFFWVPPKPDLFLESGQCRELSQWPRKRYPEGIMMILGGLGVFLWWWINKSGKINSTRYSCNVTNQGKIILGIFLLTIVFIEFYNRQIFEYYYLYLFPWLAIVLGIGFDFLWRKTYGKQFISSLILVFIILNLFTLFTSNFSYSYKDKMEVINFVKDKLSGKSYSLEALGGCPRFGGYRYLFEHFISAPVSSYMDSYFSWLYFSGKIEEGKPVYIVLLSMIYPQSDPNSISKWEVDKLRFLSENNIIAEKKYGLIQVYILSSLK